MRKVCDCLLMWYWANKKQNTVPKRAHEVNRQDELRTELRVSGWGVFQLEYILLRLLDSQHHS